MRKYTRTTVYPANTDTELEAIARFLEWGRYQNADTKHRALNYLCVRLLGSEWDLPGFKK